MAIRDPSQVTAKAVTTLTAQFLSSDPLKAMTGEAYAYAGDNLLSASDPTGLIFGISGTLSWGRSR